MSLDRKDFRGKLHPDVHAAMALVCEADGLDHGEWIAALIEREVRRRVHEATVIAGAAARLGIVGKTGESRGIPGNRGETGGMR